MAIGTRDRQRAPAGTNYPLWTAAVLWTLLALAVHVFGVSRGLYIEFVWFQHITHAASAGAIALLAGAVGLGLELRHRRLLVFVITLTAALAVGWEVAEFLGPVTLFGVNHYFGSLENALFDMVSNAGGTTLAVTGLYVHTNLEPH